MPIVRIVPHDAAGHCPLLENNKCVVHECKPVVCAMYPIGRTICIDTSVKKFQGYECQGYRVSVYSSYPLRQN